ncbi:MAG TPA: FkbM family methyltransferase [Candidatus Angelobacter sp.]|jgi:FkbM family methyltransferase|nr:FkbM family methyltransferase [Candidatus Angelobacter sp.]
MRVYIEECRLSNGLILRSDSRTPVQELYKEVYRARTYTPAHFPAIQDNDVVIDLGANIGIFALYAASIAPTVRVHAFEPAAPTFALLQQNVALNKLSNIQCYRYSVSGVTGKSTLYVTNAGSTADTMIMTRVSAQEVREAECVDCLSLDDLFLRCGIEHCNFLKVDVEGSEFNIFSFASPETLCKIGRIAMEYHEIEGRKGRDLAGLLESQGFYVQIKPEPASDRGMIYATRSIEPAGPEQ